MENCTKLKLCIVIQSLDVGGSSQVVFDLINNWYENNTLDLSLIVFFDNIDEKYCRLLEMPNLKIYFLHKKRTIDIPFMFRLKKTIKAINPDIISTHLTCVAYLNFFVNYKKCIVFHTIHSMPDSDLPKIYRMLIRNNIRRKRIRLICCHQFLVPSTEKLYKTKVSYVNNGIRAPSNLDETEKKYDLIIIGRMSDVKRFDNFVRIVDLLRQKKLTVKAAICGYGPEKENILKLRDELGLAEQIDYFDEKNDVKRLYKLSKIFVSCSTREGSPIVMLEANSYGLPVVATSVGSVPAMIKQGLNGFLYEPNDLASAVDIISSMLTNSEKLEQMSIYSYNESKKHTDTIMADEYLNIFMNAKRK